MWAWCSSAVVTRRLLVTAPLLPLAVVSSRKVTTWACGGDGSSVEQWAVVGWEWVVVPVPPL